MSEKPTHEEVLAAIAYFRSTSNRHDLCDVLLNAFGGDPTEQTPEEAPPEPPAPSRGILRGRK